MALRIAETGVRSGEIVIGAASSKQCRGTIFELRGFYPPLLPWVANLSPEQLRDQFNNYRFFRSLSATERVQWLQDQGSSHPDLYLEDVPGLEIKFQNIGGEFMLQALTPEQVNQLLAGNPDDPEGYWPIQTVYRMFPRKPNSRAKKHTLIFRPNNWTLQEDGPDPESRYEGLALHLESGTVMGGQFNRSDFAELFLLKAAPNMAIYTPTLAILATTSGLPVLSAKVIMDIGAEIGLNLDIMEIIRKLIGWFPPSLHKSLIQKILRVRCTMVLHNEILYPAKEMLATSMALLMAHPGAFVPNIQRFVSGLESALKRLAVAIFEDAWLENGAILTSLLAGAWIAQNYRGWIPSKEQIQIWLGYGCLALDSPGMYQYDWHTVTDPVPIPEWTPWYMSYFLLATIRSFASDIKMVASIAQHQGHQRTQIDLETNRIMPLIHCVDQHSFTEIVHYLPYNLVADMGSYSAVFKRIWMEVVGLNSRTGLHDFIDNPNPFFQAVRRAQDLFWQSRTVEPISLPILNESMQFEYQLHPGWLAALVGSVEIGVGGVTAVVMINPDDLFQYTAVKRPSRDQKSPPELTEVQKATAIQIFRDRLIAGISLIDVPATLPMFAGTTVRLEINELEESYVLVRDGQEFDWNRCLNLGGILPLHPASTGDYLMEAITFKGVGIRLGAAQAFDQFLRECPPTVLQRAMVYLGYATEIELHHIGRDGTGTDYTVTVEDTGVHELFSMIAALYPGALRKRQAKYLVQNGPLMWSLITQIQTYLTPPQSQGSEHWPPTLPERRLLWEHQTEAIQNLIQTRGQKRARLIWIDAGLGKTAIIANYIAYLIEHQTMDPYCLYTLPPSALATVIEELELLGIPWVHLDLRMSARGPKELIPGRINLIYHDHLRMLNRDQIQIIASSMLFIVDEFHKTLNPTLRTSTALELSYLARDCIAMTGTLIKDTNLEPILVWLSMAVNFEVTSRNYWVAMSSIISRKVQTRVGVERIVREAELSSEERVQYYESVPPKLGGTASQIQFKMAVELSYAAITREMVTAILSYLSELDPRSVELGSSPIQLNARSATLNRGVFVVARNRSHQVYLGSKLSEVGVSPIFLIGHDQAIDLTPTHPAPGSPAPRVVITTPTHAEGYNMTRFDVMVSGVYMINTSTQIQLESRINRLSQPAPRIQIVLIHAGIISYIYRRHESARHLNETLRGFAKEIGLTHHDLMSL